MKNIIVYSNSNGVLSVVCPSPSYDGTLEELAEQTVPVGLEYFQIESNVLPEDLTFQLAWEISETGDSIEVNPTKAKEIWKDKWREARKPKLEALDLAYMRATEEDNNMARARIINAKQELRDVTNTPIPGTTPEEIKAVWPEILN